MRGWGRVAVTLAVLLAAAGAGADPAAADSEQLRSAKALFFDGRYAEARGAWEAVLAGGGPDAEAAAYWVARCSEGLGEPARALTEYGLFLERTRNRALAEEARTARLSLAAKLHRQGQTQHLSILTAGLADESPSVRTFAALQLAGLGPGVGKLAVPMLCQVLASEKDPDLADRAKLALLKVDPQALSGERCRPAGSSPPPAPAGKGPATWIRVRIYEKGRSQPNVAINLPLALGDLIFKSLPEDARQELQKKGLDADTFWERLRRLGPTELIQIQGDDGERIEIRTE